MFAPPFWAASIEQALAGAAVRHGRWVYRRYSI